MSKIRVVGQAIPTAGGQVLVVDAGRLWAEVLDPVTGRFNPTRAMPISRFDGAAAPLQDGRALFAGGFDDNYDASATSVVYDPASADFSAVGSMVTARAWNSATQLRDGRVLVAGGATSNFESLSSTEVYDPVKATFSAGGPMSTGRSKHTATLLADGRVLICGGYGPKIQSDAQFLASAELYDPLKGTFVAAGSMKDARVGHTATLLSDGRVLVAGGADKFGVLSSAEVFDPGTGIFRSPE
jgi:hypothetical protein